MGWSDDPSDNMKNWLSEYEGSLMCGCDHGCNQWREKNQSKAILIMRILSNGGTTNPDKIVQMENSKVDKILYRILRWQSQKFNRELRLVDKSK